MAGRRLASSNAWKRQGRLGKSSQRRIGVGVWPCWVWNMHGPGAGSWHVAFELAGEWLHVEIRHQGLPPGGRSVLLGTGFEQECGSCSLLSMKPSLQRVPAPPVPPHNTAAEIRGCCQSGMAVRGRHLSHPGISSFILYTPFG